MKEYVQDEGVSELKYNDISQAEDFYPNINSAHIGGLSSALIQLNGAFKDICTAHWHTRPREYLYRYENRQWESVQTIRLRLQQPH